MPPRADDSEGDDDDDDDLAGETEDLSSPSISDIEDAFLGSGSDGDAPTAVEREHDDNLDDVESSPSGADNLLDIAESTVNLIEYDAADCSCRRVDGFWRRRRLTDNKQKRSKGGARDRRKKHCSIPNVREL